MVIGLMKTIVENGFKSFLHLIYKIKKNQPDFSFIFKEFLCQFLSHWFQLVCYSQQRERRTKSYPWMSCYFHLITRICHSIILWEMSGESPTALDNLSRNKLLIQKYANELCLTPVRGLLTTAEVSDFLIFSITHKM